MPASHTMEYVETNAQRNKRLNERVNLWSKILHKTFFNYYIHLPFYVITQGDAFLLHTFCLTIVSLGLFGIVKYCLLL
ncbi:hypothetical protein ZYGR_0P02680 [Zygosaccharomyces rouxii]|uniref:ZYRO0E06820p n=2 Tax=Zygosaccharomyces rouxii TaxID=4956 RepID=C5E4K3_ZYGRC|nr:uncharacterized protein ZYRO0E06820g [Zygosaccharomyces rouxii]KAH9198179.1 hypothetical protein LQ764DRAFT_236096 [Zygosaccharomyces rouxii]GAV49623.1 hypothetical protein ZYGR_0P02680 [Zygosaccharomyces rouxii]CAR30964.1 ZYRO0E06820p [Zygosaccharomyces rouxii]